MEAAMTRTRIMLAACLATGLVIAGCAPANVEEEIAVLEERVDSLERQVHALRATGPGRDQLEHEARDAYNRVARMAQAGNIEQAKAELANIGHKYANTATGGRLHSLARELAVIGMDRPSDWGIEKWFQGQESIDLEGKGTLVVVFWETWCPHCRREVPKLQTIYEQFQGQGLQLIGLTKINKSATEEQVRDVIAQDKVTYAIAKEDGSASEYFGVSGVPAAAVVKGGKVIWRGHPARITPRLLKGWLDS
jgi:thiol-disulfide isomerase/thioredoxin